MPSKREIAPVVKEFLPEDEKGACVARLGFAEEDEVEVLLNCGRSMAALAKLIEERNVLSGIESKNECVMQHVKLALAEIKSGVACLNHAAELLRDDEAERLFAEEEALALVSLDKELECFFRLAVEAGVPGGDEGSLSDMVSCFVGRHLRDFRGVYRAFWERYFSRLGGGEHSSLG